jgi:hypothetical protein
MLLICIQVVEDKVQMDVFWNTLMTIQLAKRRESIDQPNRQHFKEDCAV